MKDSAATVRPFADVLRDLGKGMVADEASVALTDLVQQVQAHGKKGRVTLHVEVEPFKGSVGMLLVSARVDSRLPQADPVTAVFFPDDHGNLHRNDPRQGELPIREVARADADLRDVK
jgi:hypothetical protein